MFTTMTFQCPNIDIHVQRHIIGLCVPAMMDRLGNYFAGASNIQECCNFSYNLLCQQVDPEKNREREGVSTVSPLVRKKQLEKLLKGCTNWETIKLLWLLLGLLNWDTMWGFKKEALYVKILTFLKVNLDFFILIYHWITVEFKIISVNA